MVEGLKIADWRQDDRQSGKTLAISMWNSRAVIQVYDSKDFKNKAFNKSLTDSDLVLFEKYLNKITSASPEQKFSLQFQKYDRNSKQYRMDAVVTLEKDSKQQYRITCTDCVKNTTFTFTLRSPATVTVGNEPLNDAALSAVKLDTLRNWVKGAWIWAPFTFQPRQNGGGGYGGGSRGGYQGGGSSGGSSDSDDLPF